MGKSKKVPLIQQKIKILENPFLDLEVLRFERNLFKNQHLAFVAAFLASLNRLYCRFKFEPPAIQN